MIGLGHALSHALAPAGVVTAPYVGPLDAYVAEMAECWSHRRRLLSSYVGALLQGRRTSDSTPLDVGTEANGELTMTALQSFAGSESVALTALRGQLNGLDMLQPTAESQRLIVDNGTLITVAGKPASRGLRGPSTPDTIGGGMYTDTFTPYTSNTLTLFLRGSHDTYSGWFTGIVDAYFGFGKDLESSSASHTTLYRATNGYPGLNWTGEFNGGFNADYLISVIWDGTAITFRDGTNIYAITSGPTFDINRFMFGCLRYADDQGWCSKYNFWQEAAVWFSDQTANEAAIRSALMS